MLASEKNIAAEDIFMGHQKNKTIDFKLTCGHMMSVLSLMSLIFGGKACSKSPQVLIGGTIQNKDVVTY